MKRSFQRGASLALALLLCILSSGCTGFKLSSIDELYSLPRLPEEYQDLEAHINAILESGAEYAAPQSGSNIQPVQLVDLDGDGQEEALAFLRKATDEKPLKIYIFGVEDGSYQQIGLIEGSGTSIFSVVYSDINNDGSNELLVGWKVASEMQILCVYSFDGEPVELMRTNYVKYALRDLDGDGMQELVALRADNEGTGIADLFVWQQETLALRSSAALSVTMAELNNLGRITAGALQGGERALFVVGVADSSMEITDILTMRQGELSNIVLSNITGATSVIARYLSLYPADINGDGVTEVPMPVMLSSPEGSDEYHFRVEWCSYDIHGGATVAQSTYHDIEDGWYLTLPASWTGRVSVSRSTSAADEAAVTFYIRDGSSDGYEEFLKIYTITGNNREVKAVRDSRIVLNRQAETIYSARLLEANSTWEYGLTEDELRAGFSLITTEWAAGDN